MLYVHDGIISGTTTHNTPPPQIYRTLNLSGGLLVYNRSCNDKKSIGWGVRRTWRGKCTIYN